eukprot:TRINITY_DN8335_c0_g1_i3.p1 TRINITY_DN8335_c0_g1~~TRINITY_DN8335_c0_g1_i3.p1  ORF type:complete len:382 (+),score=63.65 TRINITY_DN8335_c0_g1_i3:58-1203(+)
MALRGLVAQFATVLLFSLSPSCTERLKDATDSEGCASGSLTSESSESIVSDNESKTNPRQALPSMEMQKRFWQEASCDLLKEEFVREYIVQDVQVAFQEIADVAESWKYGSGWLPAYQAALAPVKDREDDPHAVFEQRDAGLYWKPGVYFMRPDPSVHSQNKKRLSAECGFSYEHNLALSIHEDCFAHETEFRVTNLSAGIQVRYELDYKHAVEFMFSTREHQEPGTATGLSYGAGFKYMLNHVTVPLFLCVGSEGSKWTAVQKTFFSLRNKGEVKKIGKICKYGGELCEETDPETWTEFALEKLEFEDCGRLFSNKQCLLQVRKAWRSWSLIDTWSAQESAKDTGGAGNIGEAQHSAAMTLRCCSKVFVQALLALVCLFL